ncbi:hypothetical protein LY76DRAFT_191937 [Colletotrichum caudatum]|nr:hypothetical protein LY76DRAFT_191937 [Colletotrichum caudatum]
MSGLLVSLGQMHLPCFRRMPQHNIRSCLSISRKRAPGNRQASTYALLPLSLPLSISLSLPPSISLSLPPSCLSEYALQTRQPELPVGVFAQPFLRAYLRLFTHRIDLCKTRHNLTLPPHTSTMPASTMFPAISFIAQG